MGILRNLETNTSQFVYYKSTENRLWIRTQLQFHKPTETYRMVTKKPETRMVVIGCTVIKKYNKSLVLYLNLK